MPKTELAGLPLAKLTKLLSSYPAYRSVQIYQWLIRGVGAFDEMRNLPIHLRRELDAQYNLISGRVCSELSGKDGSVKLGIELEDGAVIESVILQDKKHRKTACLSTQAGCPLGCVFCKTGKIGFKRNLTALEIAGQFLHLKKRQSEISHIVIMGMGEPLLNLEELRKAHDFFTEKDGLNISKKRITLSTCGIKKGILELAGEGPDIRLAISLTTAREELRRRLMPAGSQTPLPRLKEALLEYQRKRKRRITLEMVLLCGINTGIEDADAAADFASGLEAVFNLIPWNPVDGLEFKGRPLQTPSSKETAAFVSALESRGLKVTLRIEKGRQISGACGQLGAIDSQEVQENPD